jgi:hypothetical protein
MDPRFIESGASRYVSPIAGEQTKLLKGAQAGNAAAAGGKLFRLRVCNTTAAIIYALVFDGISSDPLIMAPVPIPANGQTMVDLTAGPVTFVNGLTIASSTSAVTNTAAGANSLQIDATFK